MLVRRVIALVILIGAVTLLVIGVKAAVAALTKDDAAQKNDAPILEPVDKDTNVPTYFISEDTINLSTTPIETVPPEPQEPTIEEMLASGILTDDIALSYELQLVAREAAETFNVPYKLLLAVMFRESSYNPKAANDICFGLMQIHEMNFDWLHSELAEYGVTDIKNNPEDNIYAGAYMLGNLIGKYDDYHKALMAYNCGEYRAKELWAEGYLTSQYSRNVHATMEELEVAE